MYLNLDRNYQKYPYFKGILSKKRKQGFRFLGLIVSYLAFFGFFFSFLCPSPFAIKFIG